MIATPLARFARTADPLADCTGTWWVAMTRPRYEAKLVQDMRAVEDGRTILIREKVMRWETDTKGRDHKRTDYRPLFPGYVFLNGDAEYRYAAQRSIATIQIIDVGNQDRLHAELRPIVIASEAGAELGTAPLAEGIRVRITEGNYRGFEGFVLDTKPGLVHLAITTMGTCATIEVSRQSIEPV